MTVEEHSVEQKLFSDEPLVRTRVDKRVICRFTAMTLLLAKPLPRFLPNTGPMSRNHPCRNSRCNRTPPPRNPFRYQIR